MLAHGGWDDKGPAFPRASAASVGCARPLFKRSGLQAPQSRAHLGELTGLRVPSSKSSRLLRLPALFYTLTARRPEAQRLGIDP